MTHRERAEAVVLDLVNKALPAYGRDQLAMELIHTALIEASNHELARCREVEAARDRAVRLQAALEVRNGQLEQALQDLRNILEPVFEATDHGSKIDIELLDRADEVLTECLGEETI